LIEFDYNFNKGIIEILVSLLISTLLLILPSILFYRILIGKIPVSKNYQGFDFYYGLVLILGATSFSIFIDTWIWDYFTNPPEWLLPLLLGIIWTYGIHKILKRFVFDFNKKENEKNNKNELQL
jgi:hypothetical protein